VFWAQIFKDRSSMAIRLTQQIAVGPNQIVTVTNFAVTVFDKSGNLLKETQLPQFLFAFTGCCYDPQALYDPEHQRFFVLASQNTGTGSHLLLAVTDTSDALGTYHIFDIDLSATGMYPDFPGMGITSNGLYIGTHMITRDNTPDQSWILVIGLAEVLSGNSTLNITYFKNVRSPQDTMPWSLRPALTFGATDFEYILALPYGGFSPTGTSYFMLFEINTSGTPTLTTQTVPVYTFYEPPMAPQPGSTDLIATGGTDLMNAVYRNGSLWTAHSELDSTQQHCVIRWYEINPASLTVRQTGTVNGFGDAYYPAITVMANGDMAMVFSTSSPTQYASAAYAYRLATEVPGAISTWGVSKAGVTSYTFPRWGDYSGIAVDPGDDTIWGLAEFADQLTSVTDTWVTQLVPPPSSGCTAPLNSAVICEPADGATVTSPMHFVAAASSSQGISAIWTYVDDVVASKTTNSTSVDTNLTLSAGTHVVRIQAWDNIGNLYQARVTVTVPGPGTCTAPMNSAVVCQPSNGATVTSPLHFVAAASSSNGISAIWTYVDNVVASKTANSTVDANLTLPAGSHVVRIQAWDNAGNLFQAGVTVNVSGCSPPSAGAVICTPANGATVTSPMHWVAEAASPSGISAIWTYVDNLIANQSTSSTVDTNLDLSTGTHVVRVQAWDKAGNLYQAGVTVNVSGPSCSPPSSGAVICSPSDGASVTSPMHWWAKAASPFGISAIWTYVDNVLVNQKNGGTADTYLMLGKGVHNVRVQAWDFSGALFRAGVNVNVQ
jgi:hypothetical protein